MTDTLEATARESSTYDDACAWIEENWSVDLTIAQWWERLTTAGWAAPALPPEAFGRGLPRESAAEVHRAIRDHRALAPPSGLGLLLAAPTIAIHGTPEQVDRYVWDIVSGRTAWCQLFSEPGAGSDLAGVQTHAERDGDEWVINGQKVWTSGAQIADYGMLIARTDPTAPKHSGISYFAIDMAQGGVETRPLREMTGRALFNEVFLTDARVADDARIGELHQGWTVANTTLMLERAGLGAGGEGALGGASPGTRAGDLNRRAGDFVSDVGDDLSGESVFDGPAILLRLLADTDCADATLRDDVLSLHSLVEVARLTTLRVKAGANVPGFANIAKLTMGEIMRRSRDLGMRMLGARGMLHAYTEAEHRQLEHQVPHRYGSVLTELALFAQGPPIYGGTDQIQRNILGERVLGLPREPGPDRTTPFNQLPKSS